MAPHVYSLAQAKVNPLLFPFVVDDDSIRGREPTAGEPMVGLVMSQVMDGVGFVTRLMIGEAFHRRGDGRTTKVEVVRRLQMMPKIESTGTSVAKGNAGGGTKTSIAVWVL